jgi:hypothetical protein
LKSGQDRFAQDSSSGANGQSRLNGRSSLATVEELLLTTAVGEATARPIGYASVAETEELVEVLPPPQPLKKRVRQMKLKNFLFFMIDSLKVNFR